MMNLGLKLLWWVSFLMATFALSKVFEASRLLTSESPEGNLGHLLLWGVILVANLMVMGYDAYIKSRAEGKVVRRIEFFEKIHHYLTTRRNEQCR